MSTPPSTALDVISTPQLTTCALPRSSALQHYGSPALSFAASHTGAMTAFCGSTPQLIESVCDEEPNLLEPVMHFGPVRRHLAGLGRDMRRVARLPSSAW